MIVYRYLLTVIFYSQYVYNIPHDFVGIDLTKVKLELLSGDYFILQFDYSKLYFNHLAQTTQHQVIASGGLTVSERGGCAVSWVSITE